MPQFGREYELVIGLAGRAVILTSTATKPGLRLAFQAERSTKHAANTANLRIFNLAPLSRDLLAWDEDDRTSAPIPVRLSVGYDGRLDTVFQGFVSRASSRREGADWVTEVEAKDGGSDLVRGFVSATVRGRAQAVEACLATWPNTQQGAIGKTLFDILRPRVLVGQTSRVLRGALEKDQDWFIDQGRLHILRASEVRQRFVPLVSAATGLLDAPMREKKNVTFRTLINPSLLPGGLCLLRSVQVARLDGVYKIAQIDYSGDTHAGDWTATVTGVAVGEYVVAGEGA